MTGAAAGLTERAAIDLYLAEFTGAEGEKVSYLEAAIRDARAARDGDPPAMWLATTGYLIAVEQIGHTVALTATAGKPRTGSRDAFCAAAADFGDPAVSVNDAHVLYSLRCALAHEYGLHNKGKESFFFAYRGDGPLLQMRKTPWDGKPSGVSPDTTTFVGLPAVWGYVERLVANLRARHRAGDVVLVDGVTPDAIPRMRIFSVS